MTNIDKFGNIKKKTHSERRKPNSPEHGEQMYQEHGEQINQENGEQNKEERQEQGAQNEPLIGELPEQRPWNR